MKLDSSYTPRRISCPHSTILLMMTKYVPKYGFRFFSSEDIIYHYFSPHDEFLLMVNHGHQLQNHRL